MIQLFSILTFFLSVFGVQPDKQLNDPKAKTLLDELTKSYKEYNSIEANFSLTTQMPFKIKQPHKISTLFKGKNIK